MPDPAPARVIAERYRLDERLGAGGVGAVWRARDLTLERDVAVKVIPLHSGIFGDADAARSRVLREARAAARLRHPSVVEVFDVIATEDAAYLVMGLVAAPTLTDRVRADGPLAPVAAAELGLAILGALEAAHAAGIVHRDVKPSNVLLPGDGRVVLTDFGIAAVADNVTLTAPGTIMGSPSYMAPEQASGTTVGPPADLWGLGATLYFAVEGVPPYERSTAVATAGAVVHEAPRPAERAGPLQTTLAALLEKDPATRADIGTAGTLLAGALEPQPSPESVAASPARRGASPVQRGASGSRRGVLVAAALVLVALVAGAALFTQGRAPETTAAATDVESPAAPQRTAAATPGSPRPGDVEEAPEPPPTATATAIGEEEPEAEEPAPSAEPTAVSEPTAVAEQEPGGQRGDAGLVTAAGPAPDGWRRVGYEGSAATVAVPSEWSVVERRGTLRDISAPGGLPYLRLDNAAAAPADPVAAWEQQSASFAAAHAEYEEIRIVPVDFRGYDAALWEYAWTEGGARLHAYNLGIDVDGTGHALNLVTRDAAWDEAQELFDGFTASFDPEGS